MKEDFPHNQSSITALESDKPFYLRKNTKKVFAVFLVLMFFIWYFERPHKDFPVQTLITIEEGKSLAEISQHLKSSHIIRSELLFDFIVIARGGERSVMAGDYFFSKPLNTFTIARRLTKGEFGITPIRITVPEGLTVTETAGVFKKNILNFDEAAFIALAAPKEGFLFPDTYFFLPNISPEEVIGIMEKNFEKRVKELSQNIEDFGKSMREVITMASIIEREVFTHEDRRIVSGILWKRISIGMPLQVDAAFIYVNGTTTPGLTLSDLKIDSPYNTYRYKGLPVGPIGNPGLDSLRAAIEPKLTPYLYYLSDSKGIIHYAETFEEHKANRIKYLNI